VTGFLLAKAAPPPTNGAQLVLAALIGIAVIVVLITRFSVNPFLSLTIGSLVVAAVAGMPLDAAITSSRCVCVGLTMTTASTAGSSMSAAGSV